jgi:uncharacterized protein (TIGR00375 family)
MPAEQGFYSIRGDRNGVRFVITGEISCIYRKGGRVRKVHILVIMSSIEAAERLGKTLLGKGANLVSDGRPILEMDAEELLKICLDADNKCLFVPAHCFTPWFGVFGSKSGFDSLEECFGKMAPYVLAVESGLCADPSMIWRIPEGKRLAVLSNSDAHSSEKIGREANVFDTDFDYNSVYEAISSRDKDRFLYTVEFYPEEGKYYHDGHRTCKISLSPEESYAYGDICPVCEKRLTIGVLNRVSKLGVEPVGYSPNWAIPFKRLVPLKEIIAESLGCGELSKKVISSYDSLLDYFGTELNVLMDAGIDGISGIAGETVAEGVKRMREGKVSIIPGYDGEFGTVSVFTEQQEHHPIIGQKRLL